MLVVVVVELLLAVWSGGGGRMKMEGREVCLCFDAVIPIGSGMVVVVVVK